jgi:SAM-dependent methyltransferase
MALDVVDLRAFYASSLGRVARRFVSRAVRSMWPTCAGESLVGLGYGIPYLGNFRDEAHRVFALMPAEQGVSPWPEDSDPAVTLVDIGMLPLPDGSVDRALVVHALEVSAAPRDLLTEVWRILTPGGRMLLIVPSRLGLWSRREATPFGQGQPFSRGQLRELLRDTLFSPEAETEALYFPPFERRLLLQAAAIFERIGGRFALPGGGVHLIEAKKQVYRPIPARTRMRRTVPSLRPALEPRPIGTFGRDSTQQY